jgi:hypothetical protein
VKRARLERRIKEDGVVDVGQTVSGRKRSKFDGGDGLSLPPRVADERRDWGLLSGVPWLSYLTVPLAPKIV